MRYLIIGTLVLLASCEQKKSEKELDKVGHLKNLMTKIGFVTLPFTYDIASSEISSTSPMDHNAMDTLFFESGRFHGVLPDTANVYCIFYYQTGDSLYPFLTTIDKSGNVIDTKNIGIGYCGGMVIEVDQCVDQVTISEDMRINMLYKAAWTEKDDSTQQSVKICNTMTGTGRIDKDGKIQIAKTEMEKCL